MEYNHDEEDLFEACGTDQQVISDKLSEVDSVINRMHRKGGVSASMEVKVLEEHLTKRELAVMVQVLMSVADRVF